MKSSFNKWTKPIKVQGKGSNFFRFNDANPITHPLGKQEYWMETL